MKTMQSHLIFFRKSESVFTLSDPIPLSDVISIHSIHRTTIQFMEMWFKTDISEGINIRHPFLEPYIVQLYIELQIR